jgi:adenosylcobinamide kinase / adenosylcobinamide-phosphate guanylyltransferase
MRVLYFGGQKSGKSRLAEKKALKLATQKPYYIATYDNSYGDIEMQKRLDVHQTSREEKFITIEEPKELEKVIKKDNTYLIDCLSMWILNNLNKSENELVTQLKKLKQTNANIIFVLNDVNSGIIPLDKESRKFVDLSGIIGQYVASICNEVYEVKLGIEIKIK